MSKRRHAYNPAQMSMSFGEVLSRPSDGMLGALDRKMSSAVARILKEDDRDRYDMAAAMSRLLDAEISKSMLDKYSSETSEEHNISWSRAWALIGASGRYDVLRDMVRLLGCDLVVGEEVLTVELGHVQAQIQRLQERHRQLRSIAPEIATRRGGSAR
jgi:hypothetical protein